MDVQEFYQYRDDLMYTIQELRSEKINILTMYGSAGKEIDNCEDRNKLNALHMIRGNLKESYKKNKNKLFEVEMKLNEAETEYDEYRQECSFNQALKDPLNLLVDRDIMQYMYKVTRGTKVTMSEFIENLIKKEMRR